MSGRTHSRLTQRCFNAAAIRKCSGFGLTPDLGRDTGGADAARDTAAGVASRPQCRHGCPRRRVVRSLPEQTTSGGGGQNKQLTHTPDDSWNSQDWEHVRVLHTQNTVNDAAPRACPWSPHSGRSRRSSVILLAAQQAPPGQPPPPPPPPQPPPGPPRRPRI